MTHQYKKLPVTMKYGCSLTSCPGHRANRVAAYQWSCCGVNTAEQKKLCLNTGSSFPKSIKSGKSILHLIKINCQLFIKVLRDNLLMQLVDTPTRARGIDTPHILNLVIVNNPFVVSVNHLAPLGN